LADFDILSNKFFSREAKLQDSFEYRLALTLRFLMVQIKCPDYQQKISDSIERTWRFKAMK
jgi:hypothetical protein